ADKLLGDPLDLLLLGRVLRFVAADLLAKLNRALAQLRLLAVARRAPDLELPPLARDRLGHVGVVLAGQKVRGKRRQVGAVPFSLLARLPRCELVERLDHDREVGAGLGVIEADDNVSRAHPSCPSHGPPTPPVGCCPFLTLKSTTSWPEPIPAPKTPVAAPQPPRPITSNSAATTMARVCRRRMRCISGEIVVMIPPLQA